ncbi:integrin alpha-X-like [Pangshura tecta]
MKVNPAFSQYHDQWELQMIASNPTDKHIFRVNDFDALWGIQNQLQEKIFAIEGIQSHSGSSFQLEMAQEGFSSLLSPDGSVLGAVGVYDWSGGIYLYGSGFLNVSRTSGDMNDAYLVYSVQVITSRGRRSYVVAAPRHNHTGKVILFRRMVSGNRGSGRAGLCSWISFGHIQASVFLSCLPSLGYEQRPWAGASVLSSD